MFILDSSMGTNKDPSMANNKDELNIYEINSLLFQIISCISEAERRELQVVLIDNLSEAKNKKDLSLLISSISEKERRQLLKKLINWYESKHLELRKYPRKTLSIPVEHHSNGVNFIHFIQNISNSGAYIQTEGSFHIGQEIALTFSISKVRSDITVKGKVVRIDDRGIGVKFDEPIDAKTFD
jgi:Tfp pilus assembly protein PilZ